MKKSKLILSLVGLSSLNLAVLPMSSCGNNDSAVKHKITIQATSHGSVDKNEIEVVDGSTWGSVKWQINTNAETGYNFKEWQKDGNTLDDNFIIKSNFSAIAVFETNDHKIYSLNIENAQAILVGNVNSNSTKKMYKINGNKLDPIIAKNKNGDEFSIEITSLKKIDEKWIVFNTYENYSTNQYLINLESRKCYLVPNNTIPISNRISSNIYKKDKNGNIYFISNSVIKKLDISNPDDLKITNYSAQSDTISGGAFGLNKDGELLYKNQNGFLRYRNADGSFGQFEKDIFNIWNGTNGEIYVDAYNDEHSKSLFYLFKNGTFTEYCDNPGFNVYDDTIQIANQNIVLYYRDSSPYAIKRVYTGDTFIAASFNTEHKHNSWINNNDSLFLGRPGAIDIYKPNLDPTKDTFETIDMPQYDVLNLSSLNNGTIIFNALRLKDNAYIMGTYINGVVTELSETFDDKIEYIECITN